MLNNDSKLLTYLVTEHYEGQGNRWMEDKVVLMAEQIFYERCSHFKNITKEVIKEYNENLESEDDAIHYQDLGI